MPSKKSHNYLFSLYFWQVADPNLSTRATGANIIARFSLGLKKSKFSHNAANI